jgi:hypothetical protein
MGDDLRPDRLRRAPLRLLPSRVIGASTLLLGFVAVACGAVNAEGASTPIGKTPPAEQLRETPAKPGPKVEPDAGDCPYGRLEDPHRGFVRCLEPGETDAGPFAPGPSAPAEDAGAPLDDAGAAAPPADAAPPVGPPPEVELGTPSFENGEVPKAEKFLTSNSEKIAKCIAEHGGLTAPTGKLKLQFLVRARGRAEGVEILDAKGVRDEAADCVRVLLKNRVVGPPTADPVGVTVTLTLRPK